MGLLCISALRGLTLNTCNRIYRVQSRLSVNRPLATRVPASDSCHLLVRAGSVKVVFACTFTRQLGGCDCPAATDGLDGF
jgi:hypothetical protein